MSHAEGTVYDAHGETVLGYFEYDGTSDVACTAIWPTMKDVHEHWRKDANRRECTCGGFSAPVVLRANYARGLEWESEACFTCMAITGYLSRHEKTMRAQRTWRDHPFGFGDDD